MVRSRVSFACWPPPRRSSNAQKQQRLPNRSCRGARRETEPSAARSTVHARLRPPRQADRPAGLRITSSWGEPRFSAQVPHRFQAPFECGVPNCGRARRERLSAAINAARHRSRGGVSGVAVLATLDAVAIVRPIGPLRIAQAGGRRTVLASFPAAGLGHDPVGGHWLARVVELSLAFGQADPGPFDLVIVEQRQHPRHGDDKRAGPRWLPGIRPAPCAFHMQATRRGCAAARRSFESPRPLDVRRCLAAEAIESRRAPSRRILFARS